MLSIIAWNLYLIQYRSVQLLFLNQKVDKQYEIDSQGISNKPFSIVGNARMNGKWQTNIGTDVIYGIGCFKNFVSINWSRLGATLPGGNSWRCFLYVNSRDRKRNDCR